MEPQRTVKAQQVSHRGDLQSLPVLLAQQEVGGGESHLRQLSPESVPDGRFVHLQVTTQRVGFFPSIIAIRTNLPSRDTKSQTGGVILLLHPELKKLLWIHFIRLFLL